MLQEYLEKIKQNVLNELAGEDVGIALFGSAAVGTETNASDIDVAIIPRGIIEPCSTLPGTGKSRRTHSAVCS